MFPEMSDEEFDRLCADIKANGQRKPIDLYQGVILDGRNRYKACMKLGIVPKTQPCFPDNPLDFVLSANLSRRHLTTSQRAMLGAKLKEMQRTTKADILNTLNYSKETDLSAETQICVFDNSTVAKMFNVSERSITTANQIIEQKDDKAIKDIEAGKKTLNEAKPKRPIRIVTPEQASKAAYKRIKPLLSVLQIEEAALLGIAIADHLEAIEKPSG